jgi:pyruvate formate lyase activating enzyme
MGRIFDVQRFSIHDGPGIRTTVFFKGCPLRCRWCHNPEGISSEPELSFLAEKCIGCGQCVRVCERGAHRVVDGARVFEREKCVVCGACAQECHAQALELVGREVDAQSVIDEVLRDEPFYRTSGGGMTLSGGEPTLQVEFAEELLRRARQAGIHTCVETCGLCDYARLDRVRPLVDLFLFDYKETSPEKHKEFTGAPNERIVENLRRLDADGAPTRLRCPIIPGCNDRDDHFRGIAALAAALTHLEGVELMPYHPLGESKVERFGYEASARARAEAPSSETVSAWIARLTQLGVKVVNAGE